MKKKFASKSRGKKSGPKGNNNQRKRQFTPQRKTFSLYKANNDSGFGKKRKYNDSDNDYEDKGLRNDKEKKVPEKAESSSEEEVDDMQQLLKTFKGTKPRVAIDSSEESESEDEDLKQDENSDNSDISIEDEELSDEELSDEENNNEDDGDGNIEEADIDENIEEEEDAEIGECVNSDSELSNEEQEINEAIEFEKIEKEDTTDIPNDPFVKHCLYDINESLLMSLQTTPPIVENIQISWPELGKLQIQIPKSSANLHDSQEMAFTIEEKKIYAPLVLPPKKISNSMSLHDMHLKTQIAKNVFKANGLRRDESNEQKLPLTPLQAEVFSILNNYQDFYYPQRTFTNCEELRFVYCLHAINHIIKTRLKVIHHNSRLSKKDDVPEEFRDQGLVRPKVLIVIPFRDAAYKVINILIDLLFEEDKGNVMNKNRFVDEFTGGELIMPKKNPKPDDYELLFSGNSNDDFKIGITITKKSIKLYADFYSSDIIIASPLGLRPIIGAEGEPERDYDFLASIELLIIDQTDVFLMQNWDHLLHIFKHLHMQPKESHGTDFARVRTWSLNGWAKFYRQTVILSGIQVPEINSIFNKHCSNFAGKVRVLNPIVFGSIRQVYVQMPHVYHKFNVATSAEAIDARFDFFVNKILPQQKDTTMKHTLIYVANYFDYVRLRNFFKKEDIGFVQICEYSKDNKIARARDMFFHGDAHFLLYTERYHFFNRKRIKGIRQLIFYQPPYFPHFYYEMCNLMQEANLNKKVGSLSNMTVNVIYSKYDVQQLSAIVGTERAVKMIQSDRSVHMLLTD